MPLNENNDENNKLIFKWEGQKEIRLPDKPENRELLIKIINNVLGNQSSKIAVNS